MCSRLAMAETVNGGIVSRNVCVFVFTFCNRRNGPLLDGTCLTDVADEEGRLACGHQNVSGAYVCA